MRSSDLCQRPSNGVGTSVFKNSLRALTLGAIVYLGFPNIVAYQDVAFLAGKETANRWLANLTATPGMSVFETSTPGEEGANGQKLAHRLSTDEIDPQTTGSIEASMLSTRVKTLKPQQINRAEKKGRVVSTTTKRPPAHFSAGSVVEQHSLLQPTKTDPKVEMAFVKPKPSSEAYQVAAVFHPTPKAEPKAEEKLPVMVATLVKESKSSVMAYAPQEKPDRSPFAAVLKSPDDEDAMTSITPRLDDRDHAWAASPLPNWVFSAREQACLARGIYFEARGESARGQAAVSQVILNRVRNPTYPNTICGVVYQNKNWRNRCQFSFACDRIPDRVRNARLWEQARMIAKETTAGRIWLPQVGSATHYHATYVKPRWARTMERVGKIGLHIFYRTYGGGWS